MATVLRKKLAEGSTGKRKSERRNVDGDGVHGLQCACQSDRPADTGGSRRGMERPVVLAGKCESDLVRKRGRGNRKERRAWGRNVPQSEHGELSDEELEFVQAVDQYKRENQRPFPRLTELLAILKKLGWCKNANRN